MSKVHRFDNGVLVHDHHLLDSQRTRYAQKNVHEEDEEAIFLDVLRSIPQGGSFASVGTAIGYYVILARRLRPDLRIHCFEPLPLHLRYLRDNIVLNSLPEDSFHIHPVAVSTAAGHVSFNESAFGSSIATPPRKRGLKAALKRLLGKTPPAPAHISVPAVRLADIYGLMKSDSVDFLQMDIQGFEAPVLRQYFVDHPASDPRAIRRFLVGTHSAEIHQTCRSLLSARGYAIQIDEQESQHQPDGILLASLG